MNVENAGEKSVRRRTITRYSFNWIGVNVGSDTVYPTEEARYYLKLCCEVCEERCKLGDFKCKNCK